MLGELLGRGSTGEVFSGCVTGQGRHKPVVLKRLLPQIADDAMFVGRLVAITKQLAGTQHGNIVNILDLGRDGAQVFLVMDYVDGPSLRQLLAARAGRPLPLGVATYIVQAAATGLAFARVAHSNVTASNLLITTSGELRVADFGMVREPLTPASDIFALGALLHDLIAPWPSVPPGLEAICERALAENASDRYARMQDLIDALADERRKQQWHDGPSELAHAMRESLPGLPRNKGPIVIERPVALTIQSLIVEPIRPSSPPVRASSPAPAPAPAALESGALTAALDIPEVPSAEEPITLQRAKDPPRPAEIPAWRLEGKRNPQAFFPISMPDLETTLHGANPLMPVVLPIPPTPRRVLANKRVLVLFACGVLFGLVVGLGLILAIANQGPSFEPLPRPKVVEPAGKDTFFGTYVKD